MFEQIGWWEAATRKFFGMDDGEYPTEADYGPGFQRAFVRAHEPRLPAPPVDGARLSGALLPEAQRHEPDESTTQGFARLRLEDTAPRQPESAAEMVDWALDRLPLVLDAAREAGVAERVNVVLPHSTLWRLDSSAS